MQSLQLVWPKWGVRKCCKISLTHCLGSPNWTFGSRPIWRVWPETKFSTTACRWPWQLGPLFILNQVAGMKSMQSWNLNTVGIMESMHHSLIKQALSYIEKDCVSQQELHFSFSRLILWKRTWELFLQGARSSRGSVNICIFATFSEQS